MTQKNKINRKFRKLKNNPSLFFRDFYKNKRTSLLNILYKNIPRKIGVKKKFTIVSAVYNVAPYLDDFIKSLVCQRLDFKTNIELILVDDGSPDHSKGIIEKWIKLYPENIFYIRKENGGQSSARNYGLKYVKTEWVTFIDPDDFLDVNYFYLLDDTINKNKNVGVLITKFKLFKEKFGTYHDGFQTDFCFTKPVRIVKADNMEDCVQFSSSSSLYQTDIIKRNNIVFDTKLTASFEDTKFFYEYLFYIKSQDVAYIKDAVYYYRLRANETSSSNNQWKKKAKYQQFFKYGVLSVIEKFKDQRGNIPVFIQRLVLFSVIPYLQVASISRSRIESVLTKSEVAELIRVIGECLDYVDDNVLEKFYTPPGNHFWISAIFNYFRPESLYERRTYVNKVDLDNLYVYFRFYGEKGSDYKLFLNDGYVLPESSKVFEHKIFDEVMVCEFNVCYRIPENMTIRFEINGNKSPIYSDFKLLNSFDTDFYSGYRKKDATFSNTAVFIDSGYKADDNAEHLYKSWIMDKKLPLPFESFYLLDKKSKHWDRLLKQGFKLVDINSLKAVHLIKTSKYIFCSYLPGHLNQWVTHHNFKFQKYIFLQHGVMTSNLSKPFNASYSQIYRMIISTELEKTEIGTEQYNYIFHDSDLIPLGIPRLDHLFSQTDVGGSQKRKKGKQSKQKKILVCPTWRSKFNTLNFEQEENVLEFLESDYFKNWVSFLNSEKLVKQLQNGNLEVTFCPHINLHSLLRDNGLESKVYEKINGMVKILNPEEVSYQSLFIENDLLITDYSSLHFDFASLRKPVVYFQFDQKEFYGVTHAYQKGIFDFEQHGFGPVEENVDGLVKTIDSFRKYGNSIFKRYMSRIDSIFIETNGKSTEKIYESLFKK